MSLFRLLEYIILLFVGIFFGSVTFCGVSIVRTIFQTKFLVTVFFLL